MNFTLLIFALILMICILFSRLTHKLGLPSLLFFIFLGMLFGVDGIFKIDFSDYGLTEKICTISLIFIMFYGGFGTSWRVAKPVIRPAVLLSTVGVVLTALLTGVFCHFGLKLDWIESLLIGAVISSTDAASVFSILRSKKLNLKNGSASILEVESGSNDPIAYMLTMILIGLMNQTATLSELPILLLTQIGFGTFFGVGIGLGSAFILKRVHLGDGLETIFVFATALLTYAFSTVVGGNGYLAAYLTGIIVGNSSIPNKATLVNFFDGLTGLAQIIIFFLLGLLAFPSQIPSSLLPALFIFLWLTFVARPLMTFILMKPFNYSVSQKLLLAWSGLRGASSIVFAILVVLKAPETTYDIFHISFCLCLISVALQGSLLPKVAHRLNMIDDEEDVLKTFTDYQEEELSLLEIYITPTHHWVHRTISELNLGNVLILMIKRQGQTMIPNGETKILPDDLLVVSGTRYKEQEDVQLEEVRISKKHYWVNQQVKDLKLNPNQLIILVRKVNGEAVIPKGETWIQRGDRVVLVSEKKK